MPFKTAPKRRRVLKYYTSKLLLKLFLVYHWSVAIFSWSTMGITGGLVMPLLGW